MVVRILAAKYSFSADKKKLTQEIALLICCLCLLKCDDKNEMVCNQLINPILGWRYTALSRRFSGIDSKNCVQSALVFIHLDLTDSRVSVSGI